MYSTALHMASQGLKRPSFILFVFSAADLHMPEPQTAYSAYSAQPL